MSPHNFSSKQQFSYLEQIEEEINEYDYNRSNDNASNLNNNLDMNLRFTPFEERQPIEPQVRE